MANWPFGDPGNPGTYGSNWRANWRPGTDGWTKDGFIGPVYLGNITPRIDGSTNAALGTNTAPALISYDRVNGFTSTEGVLGLSSTYLSQDAAGVWTLKNVEICGSVRLDGAMKQIRGDFLIGTNPTTVSVQATATASTNSVASAGFPAIGAAGTGPGPSGKFFVKLHDILCLFDYATSNTLVNVTTFSGSSPRFLPNGTYAVWAQADGTCNVNARLRNVRITSAPGYQFNRVRTTLASSFTISATPAFCEMTAGSDIVATSSPDPISPVDSTASFPSTGTILVGNDFVTYGGKTSTSFTSTTWPVGGATTTWWGSNTNPTGETSGYYIFNVDNLTVSLTDASAFPSAGVIEIDAGVEIHYQAKSGNNLTGCAVACRFAACARTFPAGTEVRTMQGQAYVESIDAGNFFGGLYFEGAKGDVKDCMQSYGGKGPGSFHFQSADGTTVDRHYIENNWYDVAHVQNSCDNISVTNSVFVTHCGTGNTGQPHVDGFQGWACSQSNGGYVLQNCAFIGSLTNAHQFWSSAAGTSANNSNLPPANGMVSKNCLFGASPVGSTGGKGGLMTDCINCGSELGWYDSALLTLCDGPSGYTTLTANVSAGASTIFVASATNFSVTSPVTTTLTSDITIAEDLYRQQVISSITLTSAASFAAAIQCYMFLDDGVKQCCLRGDVKATNTINSVRWMNGTPGTYTAASTTVTVGKSSSANETTTAPTLAIIATDSMDRYQIVRYTGISGNSLTGVQGLEWPVPAGAKISALNVNHPVPVRMVNRGNRFWDTTNNVWKTQGVLENSEIPI